VPTTTHSADPPAPRRSGGGLRAEGPSDHPTADDIHAAVREHIPQISRTTVYRVLDFLVRFGIITKISHTGSVARFDPDTGRHHHLLCLRCGEVIDINGDELDALTIPDRLPEGFQTIDYCISVRGICSSCQKEPGATPRLRRIKRRAKSIGGKT
jgi:Fe2+ or Zn2+ uptake regulation protein